MNTTYPVCLCSRWVARPQILVLLSVGLALWHCAGSARAQPNIDLPPVPAPVAPVKVDPPRMELPPLPALPAAPVKTAPVLPGQAVPSAPAVGISGTVEMDPEEAASPTLVEEQQSPTGWKMLPANLLWTPPLANHWSPRMAVVPTTLRNDSSIHTIDTAIGGTLGALRFVPEDCPDLTIQVDMFALCLSRWNDGRSSVDVDYRFGFPVTFAWGPWSAKAGYEHTSSHLGDQFAQETGRKHVGNLRDELAFGLAYQLLDDIRAYGQAGYAFNLSTSGSKRADRWDFGIEWTSYQATGVSGRPYAALDFEFRGDENYRVNFSAQAGWEWRATDNGHLFRLGVEYYNGQSPFGQFISTREHWVGIGMYVDL